MSTDTTTPRTTSTGRVTAIAAACALAAAAVAGGIAYMAGRDATPAAAPSSHSTPSGTPSNNTVQPSNAIKTVQAELAELNFYDGPINGYDTSATMQAVKNLQREAGLPQTGHMNTQTRDALLHYLAVGSSTMNS